MTDFKELREARWYCVNKMGMATLCKSKDDAAYVAACCFTAYPVNAPYHVVQLVPVDDLRGLLERLDAAEKDAARYRWLESSATSHQWKELARLMPGEISQAIDKAMEQPE